MGANKQTLRTAVDPWLTARQSGVILDCSPYHVYRLARSGELQYKRVGYRGRGWQFLRSSVLRLAKRGA